MSKFRKPTMLEEVTAWRELAWEINLHRTITMDQAKIVECLKRMDSYVASHSDSNGTKRDPEVHQQVWGAFWTHIAQTPDVGQRKRNED